MSTEVPGSPQEQAPVTAPEPAPAPTSAGGPTKDEKMWGMLAHISNIVFPLLGALVIWLIKKEEMPFVNDQGKEALNFQITLAIGWVAGVVLSAVGIGIVLFPLLGLANLILSIMAGIKANEGVEYRYPFALRLVK